MRRTGLDFISLIITISIPKAISFLGLGKPDSLADHVQGEKIHKTSFSEGSKSLSKATRTPTLFISLIILTRFEHRSLYELRAELVNEDLTT